MTHNALRSVGLMLVAAVSGCGGQPATASDSHASFTPAEQRSSLVVEAPAAELVNAIEAAVSHGRDLTPDPRTREDREQLMTLYGAGRYAPLWVDASGRPTRNALDALDLFTAARTEGLDPADYNATTLIASSAALLASATTPPVSESAAFDAGMSANMLRYLRHLHTGRVDPRTIGFRLTAPADDHDYATALRSALADQRITEAAAEFAPPLVLYRSLRSMLARYRTLAADVTPEPSFPTSAAVRPGQPYSDAAALHRRLVTLGDLPAAAPLPGEHAVYDAVLVDAVTRFQTRHSLDADGIIGTKTHAALRVPLSTRVRQIELALERLRWLPHLSQERFLAVNIPMFRLWVWDGLRLDGAPTLGMDVIVGRALDTQTPVFVDEMRYLIFRPYWNVPSSIVRGELLPALRRTPDYFARQNFEVVAGRGDDAQPVALTAETIEQLEGGRLRVRQRPGPSNALGLVKFIFPNDANVYLHDTPAPQLFSRSRRDFSHGCVRVEDPVALAEWALQGQSEWTRDRIVAAMNGSQPLQVNLERPIQVILFYITAVVMPEDGTIHFTEDIYGHDARLDRALMRPRSRSRRRVRCWRRPGCVSRRRLASG